MTALWIILGIFAFLFPTPNTRLVRPEHKPHFWHPMQVASNSSHVWYMLFLPL